MRQISWPSRPSSLERNDEVWISLLVLGLPYVAAFLLVLFVEKIDSWAFRIAILPVLGGLQNHLQILVHEGAHFQIHPHRRWNDFLTNLFCALPFFGLLSHYRYFHLEHHRHVCDPEKDPEVGFYAEQGYHFERLSRCGWLKMLFLDVCGYHYAQFFISYNRYLHGEIRSRRMPGLTRDEKWSIALLIAIILGIVCLVPQGFFLLLFYLVLPQVTVLFLFLKLQGYGEHVKRTNKVETCTLSHDLGLLIRFFIYPLNSELHLEHHVYPTVPWYRLREFRIPKN